MNRNKLIFAFLFVLLVIILVSSLVLQTKKFVGKNTFNFNNSGTPVPFQKTVVATNNKLTLEQQNAVEMENYSQSILVRGFIKNYNPTTKVLTVLNEKIAHTRQYTGDISVNISKLDNILCWPEFVSGVDGKEIDVKQAFFSLTTDSYLFMQNEKSIPIESLFPFLEQGENFYVFILLDKLPTSLKNEGVPTAKQGAFINCPSSIGG